MKTTYNQFLAAARNNAEVIIYQDLPLETSPSECLRRLQSHFPCLALIDFYTTNEDHYSFIGFDPHTVLTAQTNTTTVVTQNETAESTENPFLVLQKLHKQNKPAFSQQTCRLTGSPIGFLGYDAIRYIENIPDQHQKMPSIPDLSFYFFRFGIYFDYLKKSMTISIVTPTQNPETDYATAFENINTVIEYLKTPSVTKPTKKPNDKIKIDPPDEDFMEKIKVAKKYIQCGDIFQTVLSRTFTKKFTADPIDLYEQLIKINPSPYQFYFQNENFTLLGASPEKIIRIQGRTVTSTPLAGTRPTGDRPHQEIVDDLLNDEKELAEHMMLVDLARNDIGKVSIPGRVNTARLTYPITLKHVIHLASDVQGVLDPHHDVIDALTANFPAGTLSGAPKIRAMQIIDELETSRRGVYGGSIVVIDHEDNLDTAIIIRHAVINDQQITVRTGCGVVFDSNPLAEAQETEHKAKSVLTAINLCENLQGENQC